MFAWSRTEDGGGGKGGPSPFVILTGLAFGSSKTPRVTSAGLDVSSAAADKNRESDLHPSGPPKTCTSLDQACTQNYPCGLEERGLDRARPAPPLQQRTTVNTETGRR